VSRGQISIFETLKITAKGVELPRLHWQRMKRGGRLLRVEVPPFEEWLSRVESYLREIPARYPFALKVSLTQSPGEAALGVALKTHEPQWTFSAREIPYTPEQYRKGVKIVFLEEVRRDGRLLNHIKSPDFLDTVSAWSKAEARGAFEGIWLNARGEIVEGSKSNIFFVRQGRLFTPALASGCLAGTRRRLVRSLARQMGIPLAEKGVFPQDLLQADEIFLTNALMGIMPVSEIENKRVEGSKAAGSVTVALLNAYRTRLDGMFKNNMAVDKEQH